MDSERDREEELNKEVVGSHEFFEYPYRWVIVALVGLMVLINGLANNTVIPIAAKLAEVYEISDVYVSAPIITSFLVYSIMNFPANHIIDTKGLRFSFLLGSGLFMMGIFLYAMVNRGYQFAIMGSISVAVGQPFIINCPAKVATYWFFDHNRPFATAIMTGLLLIGTGIGFVLPTLIVKEKSMGDDAKNQIFYLYASEFMVSAVAFVLVYLFMKKSPPTAPSIGAEQQKTDLKESFQIIKKNRKLWVFFGGYILLYGTLLSFGSTVNLLMKPYGFEDLQIALFAVVLIISGVFGSIAWSLYLKKTTNYRLTIRAIPTSAMIVMIIVCIALNAGAPTALIFIVGGLIGFTITPILPVSYDLGCELCFPIGQAQVTGVLNGGSMILTFLMTLIITSSVSFGSQKQSLICMIIYIVIMVLGTVLYFFVKIDLKRRKAEQQGHTVDIHKEESDTTAENGDRKDNLQLEMTDAKYVDFNEEQEVKI